MKTKTETQLAPDERTGNIVELIGLDPRRADEISHHAIYSLLETATSAITTGDTSNLVDRWIYREFQHMHDASRDELFYLGWALGALNNYPGGGVLGVIEQIICGDEGATE